nr:Raf kinase inhibitor-like protein YbhB/YbcL family [Parcubacteria group bacterium]
MKITSTAFEEGGAIPSEYTCDGDRLLSPALQVEDVPEGARFLALIADDPDVPKALMPEGVFTHWVLFNIPADTEEIPEGETVGTPGANGRGDKHYTGPCPPTDHEPSEHRYFFKLYALDSMLDIPEGSTRETVENAMEGHVIETAELIGRYKRTV